MSDEYTLEQEITLLEQDQALLKETLSEQRAKFATASDKAKVALKAHIQETERELQETRSRLESLKIEAGLVEAEQKVTPAKLHQVPPLPRFLEILPAQLKEIRAQLVAKPSPSEVANQQKNPLVLYAPSGMGKSLFASAIAHDELIRRNFVSGIFWISLGAEPDITGLQMEMMRNLTGKNENFLDSEEGLSTLQAYCSKRACLVVLDNAWDVRDILAFSGLGQYCQLVVTTNQKELVEYVSHFMAATQHHTVKMLNTAQSLTLLKHYAAVKENDAQFAEHGETLSDFCRGIPSALKLTGALLKQQVYTIPKLLEQLNSHACEDLPNTQACPLMRAMRVNVDSLGDASEHYIALAVFAEHNRIPVQAVLMLWQYLYHLTAEQAREFIVKLSEQGLLDLIGDLKTGYLSLQVAHYDYICAEAEFDKLHEHLLAAYRRLCGQHGWATGPKDGYFFEYLVMHLHITQRQRELKNLLLDFDWIRTKLAHCGLHSLLNDYAWLQESDQDIALIADALQRAAPRLLTQLNNVEGVATELLNQLWVKPSVDIQKLLNHAKEFAHDWQPPKR